jgi:hypothetical protein
MEEEASRYAPFLYALRAVGAFPTLQARRLTTSVTTHIPRATARRPHTRLIPHTTHSAHIRDDSRRLATHECM